MNEIPPIRCWLDWWANSSTLFGSVEVAIMITAGDAGWDALGNLVSDRDEDRDGFAFLCDLVPCSRCDSKTEALSPSPCIPPMDMPVSASLSTSARLVRSIGSKKASPDEWEWTSTCVGDIGTRPAASSAWAGAAASELVLQPGILIMARWG
ncbi:hypothetical protein [Micromonospora sp. WMMD812]|uniref:hypothetical protein n=1 Tax=Micromonospora sp. WMMD812 TaxID=3015152 RepID=UPI00248B574A|nr:hypothetical protein [Micromonospora sp. WMMD812]WBB69394.1 hypothetical protein O7603_08600 [Micromonospora sp. WMMD812]